MSLSVCIAGSFIAAEARGQTSTDKAIQAVNQGATLTQPRSGEMAKWEAGFRSSTLAVGLIFFVAAVLVPFLLPYAFRAFPRRFVWSLGIWPRCMVPATFFALFGAALAALILFATGRALLAAMTGLGVTYFEAASRGASPAFSQTGLLFGLGAAAPLAAQPALVAGFLAASPLIGGVLARFLYRLARRVAPVARVAA